MKPHNVWAALCGVACCWLTSMPLAAQTLAGLAGSAPDARVQRLVDAAVKEAGAAPGTNAVPASKLAVTVVDLADPQAPRWGAHRGGDAIYPASVVKLFYLVAAHRWLEDGRLQDTDELRRGLRDMIVDSSNEATHYVLDLLTGTTSGPELTPDALRSWHEQRNAVNRYFTAQGFAGINCNKKPWCEGPYGREVQAIKAFQPNRNQLTTDATARLMTEIALDRAVTPARCVQMRTLLARDPSAPATPEDQVHGFAAAGLGAGMKVWSKAGWTSQTRHDAALIELPGGRRLVLVVFTEGHAWNEQVIPRMARSLVAAW
jgi:hypothetical protein